MQLNTIGPGFGAKKSAKRRGRGIGSGLGKTCGSGHKGQKARSGGKVRIGFEGGQMPLHMRIPKLGFTSSTQSKWARIPLTALNKMSDSTIDILTLRKHGLIPRTAQWVKVFASGEIKKAITLKGIKVTPGAEKAIKEAGGKIEGE